MIYIGFSTTNSLLSRAIRWITKSQTSHSFIAYESLGTSYVLQADWNGVIEVTMDRFAKKNTVVAVMALEDPENKILQAARAELDDGYDYVGVLGTIFPLIGRWFKQKWKNPWNTKAMFCSELIVTALQKAGFPGADKLVASETTPGDLKDFLIAHQIGG